MGVVADFGTDLAWGERSFARTEVVIGSEGGDDLRATRSFEPVLGL